MYLKHNSLMNNVPICIVLKALGMESDMEIVNLVGHDLLAELLPSLEECSTLKVFTQTQALEFVGNNIRSIKGKYSSSFFKPKYLLHHYLISYYS